MNINSFEKYKESDSFIGGKKLILTKINNITFGFTICYDLRFPNLYRTLAKRGAEIILVPSAFTVPTGKAHWKTLLKARAIENSVFIVGTNMCGIHHANRKTYGHSLLLDPWGDIRNKCISKPKIINTTINLDQIIKVRSKFLQYMIAKHKKLISGIGSTKETINYYDNWACNYDKTLEKWSYRAPSKTTNILRSYLKGQPKYILDLACGTGLFAQEIVKIYPSFIIDGVDISKKIIIQAKIKKSTEKYIVLILIKNF